MTGTNSNSTKIPDAGEPAVRGGSLRNGFHHPTATLVVAILVPIFILCLGLFAGMFYVVADLRQEMNREFSAIRQEMNSEHSGIRQEMNSELSGIKETLVRIEANQKFMMQAIEDNRTQLRQHADRLTTLETTMGLRQKPEESN